jgi:hypothetical protein
MAFSRYTRDYVRGDRQGLSTSSAIVKLRAALRQGAIYPIDVKVISQAQRLDVIAGEVYGDAKYWWILAAASDIGWGLQIPAGTVINILDLNAVEGLVG